MRLGRLGKINYTRWPNLGILAKEKMSKFMNLKAPMSFVCTKTLVLGMAMLDHISDVAI